MRGSGVKGGRGQGTFHPPCHVLHYHMVLCPKGTSHNEACSAVSSVICGEAPAPHCAARLGAALCVALDSVHCDADKAPRQIRRSGAAGSGRRDRRANNHSVVAG